MIQLDAKGYKIIENVLEKLAIPTATPIRLGAYTLAKEVFYSGCQAMGTPEVCSKCTIYLMPMCVVVNDVRIEKQP
jgi:hypothetical protein